MAANHEDGREATCPICQDKLPLNEIEAHVQVHFGMSQDTKDGPILVEDDIPTVACLQCGEDVALDQYASHEAAHRLQEDEAAAAQLQRQHNEAEESRHFEALQSKFGMAEKSPGRGGKCSDEEHWARERPEGPYADQARARKLDAPTHIAICKAQQKGQFYEMQTAIIPLLKQALGAQQCKFQAILSGPVMHFQGSPGEVGWSCGYKNMQMQISHLLQRDKAVADAIFGGCGYVPDVTSLQAWLECAWAAGYDPMGAEQLGGKVQGTVKWVGTTEAAALLRQFGVRAHVVDFKGVPKEKAQKVDADSSARSRPQRRPQVHHNVECDSCGLSPIRGARYKSLMRQNYDLCEGCRYVDEKDTNGPYEEIAPIVKGPMDHSAMIEWVWRYFTDAPSPDADGSSSQPPSLASKLTGPVQLSNKAPLYLQHEGHSRTIIGVEKQFPSSGGGQPKIVFLILDPSTRTGPLDRALRERKGWQRMLKRGVEMLRMEDYQILYCEPGLATGDELERLKIMSSSEYFGPLEWTEERRAELNKATA